MANTKLIYMAEQFLYEMIKKDVQKWNEWRMDHNNFVNLNLSGTDFRKARLYHANFSGSINFSGALFQDAELGRADFRGARLGNINVDLEDKSYNHFQDLRYPPAIFTRANLQNANFFNTNLGGVHFENADLTNADLRKADLSRSNLRNACLVGADLSFSICNDTDFSNADLTNANLNMASFVGCRIDNALLTRCSVYGLSAWDVTGVPKDQSSLLITPPKQAAITVDDLQVAQFIYLLLNNQNIRKVIDTITSKAVLILGSFSDVRKNVLYNLQEELRNRNYLPILFDFTGPQNRDVTETVSTLAHLARFVIADLTDAKSVLQELSILVPGLPSLPVKPILLSTQKEPGMFDFFHRYPWVLDTYYYSDGNEVFASVDDKIIRPLEEKFFEMKPK